MKPFAAFLQSGDVRKSSVDRHLAASLLEQAKRRHDYISSRELTEESRDFHLDDAYKVMRTVADAWLALHGYKSYSHEASISFLQEDKGFSAAFIEDFDRLRRLRNGIRYYGKRVSISDAQLAVDLSRKFLRRMEPKIKEKAR
jgi:hypothetical protein